MKDMMKWLVRAGTLLVLLGFFMPSMLVSCTAFGVTNSQELSLAQMASGINGQQGDGALYFVLIGAFLALVASLTVLLRPQWEVFTLWVEVSGVGLSLLLLIVKAIALDNTASQIGLQVEPIFGTWVLFAGYVLAVGGVILEFVIPFVRPVHAPRGAVVVAPPDEEPAWQHSPPALPPANLVSPARLELISGNFQPRIVNVNQDEFSIGRGSANQLNIPDRKVSRTHARLRFAQGTWFIQDQNSAVGTYVNNQRVQAGRLNSGDQLRIGDVIFVFRC